MSTFSNAVSSLRGAAADFSTLTVTTYSGDLKVLLKAGQKDDGDALDVNNLDFQKILDKTLNGQVEGNLEVACFNCHYLDGDGVAFRNNSIPEEQMAKLEMAHDGALASGRETREGMLNLVKATVESIFTSGN